MGGSGSLQGGGEGIGGETLPLLAKGTVPTGLGADAREATVTLSAQSRLLRAGIGNAIFWLAVGPVFLVIHFSSGISIVLTP